MHEYTKDFIKCCRVFKLKENHTIHRKKWTNLISGLAACFVERNKFIFFWCKIKLYIFLKKNGLELLSKILNLYNECMIFPFIAYTY